MAKNKLSRKRVSSEDYDSDEGFVEDAPKQKKNKTSAPASSNHAAPEKQKDEDGNVYWEVRRRTHTTDHDLTVPQITRTRRIQVSEFKGNTMIGIREFYEKDGKMLPGKKVSIPICPDSRGSYSTGHCSSSRTIQYFCAAIARDRVGTSSQGHLRTTTRLCTVLLGCCHASQ